MALAQLDHFKWIFTTNELSNVLIPSFTINLKRFHGPGERLYNVEIYEFALADGFYTKYHKTNETRYLDLLIATLWRPSGPGNKGDKRIQFHEEDIDTNAKTLSKLAIAKKHSILINYIGLRNSVIHSPAGKKVFNKRNKSEAKNSGWGHIIMRLSGSKFGNHYETKRAFVSDILHELVINKEDAMEIKKRHKKVMSFIRSISSNIFILWILMSMSIIGEPFSNNILSSNTSIECLVKNSMINI